MGLSGSKGRRTFVSVLRHMLLERGLKVSEVIAGGFYDFIVKVAPWFPEDGSLTLEDWKRLGKDMRRYLSSHKDETPPPQTFPLWVQVRDILLEKTDLEFFMEEAPSEKDEEGAPLNEGNPPKYGTSKKDDPDDWDLDDEAGKYESEEYHPEEYNNPPPEVMISAPIKKHGKPIPKPRRCLPPVGFQGAIAQAKAKGDMSFTFPVVLYDDEEPTWEPLPLKTLKELQLAVKSLGPSAPYTIQILEMIGTQWLTVYDWFQTAKATLSPGDFVLWRTEYEERAKEAVRSSFAKKGAKPTMSMLLGKEEYTQPAAQMRVGKPILELITQLAVGSWKAIPPPSAKTTVLAGIRQKQEEAYEEFIARLEEAIQRMLPPSEGTEMLLKQLAWENANTLCQDLIRPIRKTGSIQDYIRACIDATPVVVQGMAYAAAMKGQPLKSYIKQTYGGGNKMSCFNCGQTDYTKKDCRKNNNNGKAKMPEICPRCQKGRHWKKDCRSKYHKDGTLLPPLHEEVEKQDTKSKN